MARTQEEMAWEVYERFTGQKAIRIKPQPEISVLSLHRRIESRISKLEQPVLGLKGGVDRQAVLKIIEEEFGSIAVDNI